MTNSALSMSPRLSISQKMRSVRDQFLAPGGVAVAQAPGTVATIVSTGIAACLWDTVAGIGGMAHFVLPEGGTGTRSCNAAFENLYEELIRLGARGDRMTARIYGGCRTGLSGLVGPGLGELNVEAAERWLQARGIAIVGRQCGDSVALRVTFSPLKGNAHVEQVTGCGAAFSADSRPPQSA